MDNVRRAHLRASWHLHYVFCAGYHGVSSQMLPRMLGYLRAPMSLARVLLVLKSSWVGQRLPLGAFLSVSLSFFLFPWWCPAPCCPLYFLEMAGVWQVCIGEQLVCMTVSNCNRSAVRVASRAVLSIHGSPCKHINILA